MGVHNLDDEGDSQQVGEALNVDTTLVVRDQQEVEIGSNKSLTTLRPTWLENTLTNKKMNIVPIYIPVDDMVSKCLGKVSKAKRLKTVSKIDFDEDTGNWTAQIAPQKTDEIVADSKSKDFMVEKVNLGAGTHVADALHLEVSTKKMLKRSCKDEKDKSQIKEIIRSMA